MKDDYRQIMDRAVAVVREALENEMTKAHELETVSVWGPLPSPAREIVEAAGQDPYVMTRETTGRLSDKARRRIEASINGALCRAAEMLDGEPGRVVAHVTADDVLVTQEIQVTFVDRISGRAIESAEEFWLLMGRVAITTKLSDLGLTVQDACPEKSND